MFYKLMNGDVVIDLIREPNYVRYLPKARRWINTDGQSANGVLSANGEIIYHLQGRACACPDNLLQLLPIAIKEEEYNVLLSQLSATRANNQVLQQEIDSLRHQLNQQNSLLQQILAKL